MFESDELLPQGPHEDAEEDGKSKKRWWIRLLLILLFLLIMIVLFMLFYFVYGPPREGPGGGEALSDGRKQVDVSVTSLSEALLTCSAKTQNSSLYRDDDGAMHVIGEVKNESKIAIAAPEIVAVFTDSNGDVLGRSRSFGYLFLLAPGTTSPFHVVWQAPSGVVANYKLNANCSTQQPELAQTPKALRVLKSAARRSELGYDLNGILTSSQPLEKVRVFATFYDSQGKTVAVGEYDFLTTQVINPGDEGDFRIIVTDSGQAARISSFKIQSEGWPVSN